MNEKPVDPQSPEHKPSVIRKLGKGVMWSVGLPVMLPMRAAGFMVRSFGKSIDARRRDLGYLNELRKGATTVPFASDGNDMSYDQVLRRLHIQGDSVSGAFTRFVKKKRIYLLLWISFVVLAFLTVLRSHVLVGGAMFVGTTGLLLARVFICSFRLWQLRVRRISIAEGGGVSDFLREPGWVSECFRWVYPCDVEERK